MGDSVESFEDLRLEKKDKIQKRGFLERFFKKESNISEENLDFLEERYTQASKDSVQEDSKLQKHDKEIALLDDLSLKPKEGNFTQTTQFVGLNPDEKEAVLEVDLNFNEIPFRSVYLVFALMFVALLVFVPKIYIRNNIYYTSRSLVQLQVQLDSLREDNKHIKKQLEYIKFKNLTHELDF